MGQRVVYGTASILFLLLIFRVDVLIAENRSGEVGPVDELLSRGNVLPLFVVVVVLAGAVELRRLLVACGARPYVSFAYLLIALLVLTPWLSAAGWLGTGPAQVEGLYWQVVWLVMAAVGTGMLCVLRGKVEGTFRDVGATAIMVFYLGFLPSFALQIRCGRDVPEQAGAALLLMTLLVVKASDIGAYFTGSTLGRHKLVASISPKKSIEGAIGGILASILVAVLFATAVPFAELIGSDGYGASGGATSGLFGASRGSGWLSPVFRAVIFGASMSILGQIGDLIESCFKRDAEIKDSGSILPTFGGILDLIDSPVLAMPVAWFLLTDVWRIA